MQGSRFPQNRPMIKYGVRSAMTGRLFACVVAAMLPTAASLALQLVPAIGNAFYIEFVQGIVLAISPVSVLLSLLLAVFVTDPMGVGIARFFLHFNRDIETLPSPLSVCNVFGPGYWRQVGGMLLRAVYVYGWAIIPLAIGALIPGTWEMIEVNELSVLAISDLGYAFVLLASIAVLYRELCYTMVRYVLAEYPDLALREVMQAARSLTRGRLWELFLLQLSFFGWLLLATIPLVGFYAYPYIEGVMAAYFIAFDSPEPQPRSDIYAGG